MNTNSSNAALYPAPARAGRQRWAVYAHGRFAELSAGITGRQPTLRQETRRSYFFGTGQAGVRSRGQSAARTFTGVAVPGDAAQQAVCDAAAAGAPLTFLCWRDEPGAGGRSGSGFMGRAVPALDSDGTAAVGGAEGICFTMAEYEARRPGTVHVAANGVISFAPQSALAGEAAL